jgi:hypothetical protein
MIEYLRDAVQITTDEMGVEGITHAPCLSHVIQLSLNELIRSVRIGAKNEGIITIWNDDEEKREKHTDAIDGDGAPWTLKKVHPSLIKYCNNLCTNHSIATRHCHKNQCKYTKEGEVPCLPAA